MPEKSEKLSFLWDDLPAVPANFIVRYFQMNRYGKWEAVLVTESAVFTWETTNNMWDYPVLLVLKGLTIKTNVRK